MSAKGKLEEYPALLRWYEERRRASPSQRTTAEQLATQTCEALRLGDVEGLRLWLRSFRAFLAETATPLAAFQAAEALFHRCDAALLDIIGDLGELAIRSDEAAAFRDAMQQGAAVTGLVVMRFLSAWTALNVGDLAACVDECEKIDEPFASVFTIQGQALLELGRADEALDALAVAVKLAPTEIVAWFQLAKAHHVSGQAEPAWAALGECLRLAPQSDEVALFMGIVALDAPPATPRLQTAWQGLRPRLKRHPGNSTVATTLFKLATALELKSEARALVEELDWADLYRQGGLTRELPALLRLLQAREWMDVASELLARVVPPVDATGS